MARRNGNGNERQHTSSSKLSAMSGLGILIFRISRKPSSVIARSARRRALFRSSFSISSTLNVGLGETGRRLEGSGLSQQQHHKMEQWDRSECDFENLLIAVPRPILLRLANKSAIRRFMLSKIHFYTSISPSGRLKIDSGNVLTSLL